MTTLFTATRTIRCRPRRAERGYALLMLAFFVALLSLAVMAAAPRILQEGKREKEKEMIWRGKQYARGVKLYYRKMGRFPTTIDDLTKPRTGSLRFMRQAYKDPMNAEDGSWRLIYVGPAGQLIGSLKPAQSLQLPGAPGMGTPASALASNGGQQQQSGFGSSAFGNSSNANGFGSASGFGNNSGANGAASATGGGVNGQQQGAQSGAQPNVDPNNPQAAAQNGGQPGTQADGSQGTGMDSSGVATGDAMSTPQGINGAETPTIVGGNIIGVGSKIKAPSIMVYDKAKNYRLFEFIWDPSKDTTIAGQAPMQTGTGLGQNIGTGASPFSQPGATNPNPGQPNNNGPGNNNNASPGAGVPPNPPLSSAPPPAPQPEP
jgi:hypothetical protein